MDESLNLPSAILEQARKTARTRLVAVLQNEASELIKDDTYFVDLVRTVLQLVDLDEKAFAEKIGTTGATLNRWKNRAAKPLLLTRKAFIVDAIKHLKEADALRE